MSIFTITFNEKFDTRSAKKLKVTLKRILTELDTEKINGSKK